MKTKQISVCAMLAAMCAALGALSLNFGNLKITLESLPVIVAALLFGPIEGMAVGFVGTLIYQLLRFGITATTLLWILPYVLCGLIVGLYSKKHGFSLSRKQTIFIVVLAELMISALNTGSLYIDSKIYGYYSPVFIFGSLPPRLLICVAKSLAEGALLPGLIKAVRDRGSGAGK